MIRRPPRSTRTDTLFPYTTLFRSIEFPLLAFSHCRDVVVAVSKAGGMGVFGAAALSPARLEEELAWIDDHIGGRPYGVDLIVPNSFAGKGAEPSPRAPAIPDTPRRFAAAPAQRRVWQGGALQCY